MTDFIKPFKPTLPNKNKLNNIIAPPYDVINTAEAKSFCENNPDNFLHITKPEIDLPNDTDPYDNVVYKQARINLDNFIKNKNLVPSDKTQFIIYQLKKNNLQQTGIFAGVKLSEMPKNLLIHEHTRPKKELDRVNILKSWEKQVSPVMLGFKDDEDLKLIIKNITNTPHSYESQVNNTTHTCWCVEDLDTINKLQNHLNKIKKLYIADGHHRSFAAQKAGEEYLFAALFPASELHLLGYHRLIKNLNNLSPEELLEKLNNNFTITKQTNKFLPTQSHQFGLYVNNNWYSLDLKNKIENKDVINNLEVSILENKILTPIFNITDQRQDPNIDFIGGEDCLDKIENLINTNQFSLAFTLYPTDINDLFSVAEQGEVMPPKSTWFEPKLADGLVVY